MCHTNNDRPPTDSERNTLNWYRDQNARLKRMNERLRTSNAVLIREKGALQAQAERDETFIDELAEAKAKVPIAALDASVYGERNLYRRQAERLSRELTEAREELRQTRGRTQQEIQGYRRDVRELRVALSVAEEYVAKADDRIETLTKRLDAVKEVASL